MADEIVMLDSEQGIEKNDEMSFSERIVQHVREEGFFSTFPTDNLEGQKLLYKATNASKLLRDFMETPLAINAFVFSSTTVTTEAGDVEQVMGVYLIDSAGTAYVSSSNGVIRSAMNIMSMFGNPEGWSEPLTVVCRETNTAKGRRFKFLDVL
jgi:hypothetical protein